MTNIDITKLGEALNTKADIDLNNTGVFSTVGGGVNLTSSTSADASGKEVTSADFVSNKFGILENPKRGYLVESWQDGANWYRIYSDGWLEQGGIFNGTGAYALTEYSFHKPFKDTNYFFIATIDTLGHGWFTGTSGASMCSVTDVAGSYGAGSKTTNSISIQGFSNHAWYACGMKG